MERVNTKDAALSTRFGALARNKRSARLPPGRRACIRVTATPGEGDDVKVLGVDVKTEDPREDYYLQRKAGVAVASGGSDKNLERARQIDALEEYYSLSVDDDEGTGFRGEMRAPEWLANWRSGSSWFDGPFLGVVVLSLAGVSAGFVWAGVTPPLTFIAGAALFLALVFEIDGFLFKTLAFLLPFITESTAASLELTSQLFGWFYLIAIWPPLPVQFADVEGLDTLAAALGTPGINSAGIELFPQEFLPWFVVVVYAARSLNKWKTRALRRAAELTISRWSAAEADMRMRRRAAEERGEVFEVQTNERRTPGELRQAANTYVVLDKILGPVVWAVVALLALDRAGAGTAVQSLLTFGGFAGIAVSIAAQQLVGNFFGGLVINTVEPFRRNDLITDSEGAFEGFVDKVGWFITRLQSREGPVYVPNAKFLESVVINKTSVERGRRKAGQFFAHTVSIRHSDIALVERVIGSIRVSIQALAEQSSNRDDLEPGEDGVCVDPDAPIRVHLMAIGAESLDIGVACGIASGSTEDFLLTRSALLILITRSVLQVGAQLAPRLEEHEGRRLLATFRENSEDSLWWAGGMTDVLPQVEEQGLGGVEDIIKQIR